MCTGSCKDCLMGVLDCCLVSRSDDKFFEVTEEMAIRILNDKEVDISGTGLTMVFDKFPKLKLEYGSKKVC